MRVGSKHHEVLDVLVVEFDRTMHAVGERRLTGRDLESDGAFVEKGLAAIDELFGRGTIAIETLRLKVRRMRPANFRPLVPVDPQPPQAIQDARHHLGLRSLDVGVLDAQDERAAVATGIEPVEKGSPCAANVQVTSGGRRETETGHHGMMILSAGALSPNESCRAAA